MTRRDSGDEVRCRMEMWKASVENAQSITILLVRQYIIKNILEEFHTKEYILEDYGLLC